VYAAGVAGGWSYAFLKLPGDKQYYCNATLTIGNSSANGFSGLADELKQFVMRNNAWLNINGNAGNTLLQFGSVDQYNNGFQGCDFQFTNDAWDADTLRISDSLLYVYSTHIYTNVRWRMTGNGAYYIFKDVDAVMGDGIDIPSGTSSMWLENVYLHNSLSGHVGLKLHRTPDLLKNVRVYNNYYGLQVYYGTNNVSGTNLDFRNNSYGSPSADIILNYGSGRDNITLINPSPQRPTISPTGLWSGATVLCKSEWDLNIKNSTGSGLNVSVYAEDSTGLTVINTTTDSSGNLPTQQVLYANATNSVSYVNKTPHTIKYRKYGYQFSQFSKTFGDKATDNVVLNNNLFVVANELQQITQEFLLTVQQTEQQSIRVELFRNYTIMHNSGHLNYQI
jgi:hypothetical protein